MSGIRWVCLSDTHLGAENSVLSHVPDGDVRVDPREPSPVLEALIGCLRRLVEQVNGDGSRPTLVLNGDALELAVAHGNVAAMAFDQFVDVAFAREQPLFDDTILYVPGNHDHHVWEMARESHYAAQVAEKPPEEELEAPFHALGCFGRDPAGRPEAELLTNLVRRRAGSKARVEIAYPNLAVASDDLARLVVFHHGHYIEPMYRVMSNLKQALFPGRSAGQSIAELEADNFAWIDFVWSTLGRSLDVGGDAGLIFLMSQEDGARNLLADNLGDHLGDAWAKGPLRPLARQAGHVAVSYTI